MSVIMFPGQGSQKTGMGEGLFERFSEQTATADEILGYSIKELCLEAPAERLGNTLYTQPALYAVNALSYLAAKEDEELDAKVFIGHSLGEYNALFAAGAYDFPTGLKLVKKRAELMSQATGGGMAAIIGLDADKIKEILKNENLDSIDVANYNAEGQTVISGPAADIEACADKFPEARKVAVLNVSGAFHSRYMKDAADEFGDFIKQFSFSSLSVPVIANCTAEPYGEDIADNLVKQIYSSVRWVETIKKLKAEGHENFLEIGPGKVLTGLARRI